MIHKILAQEAISLANFKKNPMAVVNESSSGVVAVLNRGRPAFYCISPDVMEAYIEILQAENQEPPANE